MSSDTQNEIRGFKIVLEGKMKKVYKVKFRKEKKSILRKIYEKLLNGRKFKQQPGAE